MVRVRVKDGTIHEGVLHALAPQEGGLGVVLKHARKVTHLTPHNAPYTGAHKQANTQTTIKQAKTNKQTITREAPRVRALLFVDLAHSVLTSIYSSFLFCSFLGSPLASTRAS